jgi:hypothetical protein
MNNGEKILFSYNIRFKTQPQLNIHYVGESRWEEQVYRPYFTLGL